jgi:hypothetical protein
LLFRNPTRETLVYWFLVCLILGGVVASVQYVRFSRALPVYAAEVAKGLPEFSFQKGRTVTALPTPSVTNTNSVPIVLDPGEKFDKLPADFTNGMFHIGRSTIKVWTKPGADPVVVPIDGFPDGRVDQNYIMNLGTRAGYVVAPFFWVVLALVFFLVGLLQALFFATLVSFLEKTIRPSFSFDEMLNISIYALTPGALIVTVYWIWGVSIVPYDLVYFFTYIVFHVMASGACRRSMMPPGWEDEEP